jgi:hypothetical protein
MTGYLQAGVAVAALVLMYLICIRPMTRSRHAAAQDDAALDDQIRELREELTQLQSQTGSLPEPRHQTDSPSGGGDRR